MARRATGDERCRGAHGPPLPARRDAAGRALVDRRELERQGYLVTRGFIDLHAHLREPGFEESETIATGAQAALRGGFTTVCAMPNTEPAIDSPGLVAEVIARGKAAGGARVLPIATVTRGRKGKELADLVELASAGAVAFSDDGSPVDDARLFRSAVEYASVKGLLVIEHPEDLALSGKGVMNEGRVSAALGLPGISNAAEETAVARAILVASELDAHVHLTHISTAGSVDMIRAAKERSIPVTCDVTPHHLAMTDDWVRGRRAFAWEQGLKGEQISGAPADGTPFDANTKMNPPLRRLHDVRALRSQGRRVRSGGVRDQHARDRTPAGPRWRARRLVRSGHRAAGTDRRTGTRARHHTERRRLDRHRRWRDVDGERGRPRNARKEHTASRPRASRARRRRGRGR
ncbi:MAG: hypothetical protein E6J38_05070 [Chloroflexi bacterium]|nr:MAG: hypothetical protein E6J38_05070 [Chloroflexota bacterium]